MYVLNDGIRVFNSLEAAGYIGKHVSFLEECQRRKAQGLPHAGPRHFTVASSALYDPAHLDEWLAARKAKRTGTKPSKAGSRRAA